MGKLQNASAQIEQLTGRAQSLADAIGRVVANAGALIAEKTQFVDAAAAIGAAAASADLQVKQLIADLGKLHSASGGGAGDGPKPGDAPWDLGGGGSGDGGGFDGGGGDGGGGDGGGGG